MLGPEVHGVGCGLFPQWKEPGLVHDLHLGPPCNFGKELHGSMIYLSSEISLVAVITGLHSLIKVKSRCRNWPVNRNDGADHLSPKVSFYLEQDALSEVP